MTRELQDVANLLPLPDLRATSVGDIARSRIWPNSTGQVHSAFEGALNISFSRGMVSVVNGSKGRGPMNIVLPSDALNLSECLFDGGTRASFDGTFLTLEGRARILLRGVEIYRSPVRFQRRPLKPNLLQRNLTAAKEFILSNGRMEGLGGLVRTPAQVNRQSDISNPFIARAGPLVTALVQRLSDGNTEGALAAGRELIGLGIGLTPSGDDVLAGFLVALIAGSKNGMRNSLVVGGLAEGVARLSVGRTTLLSQNYLELASQGRANETVVKLVQDLYTGTPVEVKRSCADLVGFGATSGTDIAAGIILGATFALQNRVKSA